MSNLIKDSGYRITTLSTYGQRRFRTYLQSVEVKRIIPQRGSRAGVALVAVLCIGIAAACGGSDLIRSFRVALAASGPLINSLVASGAIQQSDATLITRDFADGVTCADTLHRAFKAIAKDDPNAKSLKLNASVNGFRCFRVVIQRRNFEKHPKVKNAVDIADGLLASLVAFYSEPGEVIASARSARRTVSASDEKELERKLKQQVKELEEALKP